MDINRVIFVARLCACWLKCIFIFFPINAFAWNSQGHELCAKLALMHMPAPVLQRIKTYNQAFNEGYKPKSIIQSAAWLDWFKCQNEWCHDVKQYHYIDIPYSRDSIVGQPPSDINAVTAVRKALLVLNQKSSTDHDKGFALRVLLHVVADLHQPMHAVTLYDQHFPHGDRGGNEYLLAKNNVARQLHAYWDRGGGSLGYDGRRKKIHRHSWVNRLQRKYPCDINKMNLDPEVWARESYQDAITLAYSVPLGTKPSRQYQHQVKTVTQKRLVLAACRLRALLIKNI